MTDTTSPWTVEDLANRFAEAAWTAHRLPRVGPRGYFNPWMTTAFQVPDRYPDSERLYRPMPPSPQDEARRLQVLRASVLPRWLERCGAPCAELWRANIGPVRGIELPASP